MATQDPVWPPSVGGTTALEDYLAEQQPESPPLLAALFPHRRLRLDPPLCQPRRLLPWLRTTPSRAWHRPSRAKRQRQRGRPLRLAPSGRIQPQCCPPPRGQSRRSANWRTKLVGRQSLLCPACRGSSPRLASLSRSLGPQRRLHPPYPRRIPRSCPTASRPPPPDQQAPPTDLSNMPVQEATIAGTDPIQLQGRDPRGADFAHALQPLGVSNPPPPPPMEATTLDQGPGASPNQWPEHYPFRTALQQAEAARLGMSFDSYSRHSAPEIFELLRALDRREAQPEWREAQYEARAPAHFGLIGSRRGQKPKANHQR